MFAFRVHLSHHHHTDVEIGARSAMGRAFAHTIEKNASVKTVVVLQFVLITKGSIVVAIAPVNFT